MSRLLVLALALVFLPVVSAHADAIQQPNMVSFGLGYMDFDKNESHKQSGDFRAEYRWGISMLSAVNPWFKSWDDYVQFHPFVGVETTTLGALYGAGGWAMDWYICKHAVFTWSEGVGYFDPNDMHRLGSVVEFRSMAELGYRFDNDMRVTAEVSHISNAHLTNYNPGAEIVGMYVHVPTSMIFGR